MTSNSIEAGFTVTETGIVAIGKLQGFVDVREPRVGAVDLSVGIKGCHAHGSAYCPACACRWSAEAHAEHGAQRSGEADCRPRGVKEQCETSHYASSGRVFRGFLR